MTGNPAVQCLSRVELGQLALWPANAQYNLETATEVTGPWASSQAAVSETNSVQSITVPASEQRRFYRLVKTQGAL